MPTTTDLAGKPAISVFIAIKHRGTQQPDFILLSINSKWERLLKDVISAPYVITLIKKQILKDFFVISLN